MPTKQILPLFYNGGFFCRLNNSLKDGTGYQITGWVELSQFWENETGIAYCDVPYENSKTPVQADVAYKSRLNRQLKPD